MFCCLKIIFLLRDILKAFRTKNIRVNSSNSLHEIFGLKVLVVLILNYLGLLKVGRLGMGYSTMTSWLQLLLFFNSEVTYCHGYTDVLLNFVK
jgi:hypothetical protein